MAEAISVLCKTHPAREERVGERVGDKWTHPKGTKDPILFGPMSVMKVYPSDPEEPILLMTDGEKWDREELESAGWRPRRRPDESGEAKGRALLEARGDVGMGPLLLSRDGSSSRRK